MIRRKERYVAIASDPQASPSKLANVIISAYKDLFGVLGLASARLKLVKTYPDMGVAIFKCALEHLPRLLLAVSTVTELNGEPAALRIIIVSGTIRKVKEEIRGRVGSTSPEA